MTVKKSALLLFLTLSLSLLVACGSAAGGTDAGEPTPVPTQTAGGDEVTCGPGVPYSMVCRIVDGAEEGDLLLAELPTEGMIPSGGSVYRVSAQHTEVWLNGEKADSSALEDGMPITVYFRGPILETYPAQLGELLCIEAFSRGSQENPGGSFYDLCGLYLKVLDDLWKKDPALNENISVAGLDLSQAPGGLTDSEKAALAWRFGELHGVEVITGTFDELKADGYLTAMEGINAYEWQDGCLFSITANEGHKGEGYSLPSLFFDAQKWCGPLAAYYFCDCSALWPEFGTWSGYNIGAEAIS